MLAQVGNTPLPVENSQESIEPLSEPQAAATETPNVKPAAVDTKASPVKPSAGELAANAFLSPATQHILLCLPGNKANAAAEGVSDIPDSVPAPAKQDLNDKLDDAAPGQPIHASLCFCPSQAENSLPKG